VSLFLVKYPDRLGGAIVRADSFSFEGGELAFYENGKKLETFQRSDWKDITICDEFVEERG